MNTSSRQTAARLIQQQFGSEPKWLQINDCIWDYFETQKGTRLRLTEIKQIATKTALNVDNFLSVLSLLAGGKEPFLRFVYYRQLDSGQIEEISADEVFSQARGLDFETEWRNWAANVLVGWEPTALVNIHSN